MGPLLFSLVVSRTGSYRLALLSLIFFFVVGLIVLWLTDTDREHRDHHRSHKRGGAWITEKRENGETEDREISRCTNRSQRNTRNDSVRTTQNSRAARNDRTADTLSRNVFDREVKRVGKSDQCKQRGDDVKLPHLPLLRNSF